MSEIIGSLVTLWGLLPAIWRWTVRTWRALKLACTEGWRITHAVQLIDMKMDAGRLRKDDPCVVFVFTGINAALSEIELVGVEGAIRFGGNELRGTVKHEMIQLVPGPIRRLERFAFSVIQEITSESAARILDTPKPGNHHVKFNFGKIKVQFRRTDERGKAEPNLFEIEMPDDVQVRVVGMEWEPEHRLATVERQQMLRQQSTA